MEFLRRFQKLHFFFLMKDNKKREKSPKNPRRKNPSFENENSSNPGSYSGVFFEIEVELYTWYNKIDETQCEKTLRYR